MIRLPRLQNNQTITREQGYPSDTFQRWWQTFANTIEGALNGITSALEAAGIAQGDVDSVREAPVLLTQEDGAFPVGVVLTGESGVSFDPVTGIASAVPAGAYADPTGTLSRLSFATYTAPVISNPPTQAEVQAIADAVQAVSQTLGALITDMRANGNLS